MDRSPPLLALPVTVLLAACTASHPPPRTVDTSCGLDCEAQDRYGLVVGRCFEYSDGATAVQPPALGVEVAPVQELEAGGKVLPVRYVQLGGQVKMTDYFRFNDMDLLLARREWPLARSITYLAADGRAGGVTWVGGGAAAGQTLTSRSSTELVDGTRQREAAVFQVAVRAADAQRRKVPFGEYADALELTFSEDPKHGTDVLRVFAPGVGFLRLDTGFSPDNITADPYVLQGVRDVHPGDKACGE